MKKNISTIISVITCFMLVICLLQISSLKQEISSLSYRLDREMNTMNNNISGIYEEVEDMLEEESNQLTTSDWQYGEINVKTCTAEVICTVIPKVYSPEVTQTSVIYNGTEAALVYADGRYTATFEIPLFETTEFTQVKLTDNGTIRTQELDWHISPRYEALLTSYAGIRGSAKSKQGDNESVWSPEYTVNINIERKGEFQLQFVELVEILDGEEIGCIPIDISDAGQQKYADEIAKTGETVPEHLSKNGKADSSSYEGRVDFFYFLDKDYHIPNGSILELYIDVVDGNGLRYRSLAQCYAVTEDGEPDELRMEKMNLYVHAEPVLIFDDDGNVVFDVDSSLFK